jgi:hypothetical protein
MSRIRAHCGSSAYVATMDGQLLGTKMLHHAVWPHHGVEGQSKWSGGTTPAGSNADRGETLAGGSSYVSQPADAEGRHFESDPVRAQRDGTGRTSHNVCLDSQAGTRPDCLQHAQGMIHPKCGRITSRHQVVDPRWAPAPARRQCSGGSLVTADLMTPALDIRSIRVLRAMPAPVPTGAPRKLRTTGPVPRARHRVHL